MLLFWMLGCTEMKSTLMSWMPLSVEAPAEAFQTIGTVELEPWVTGIPQITDIQFLPHVKKPTAIILQKEGTMWLGVEGKEPTRLGTIPVKATSEQGLLGLALHPNFSTNQKVYIHRTPATGSDRTEIAEYTLDLTGPVLTRSRVLLTVDQPYPNHNGGAIHFGPDGMLYVGLGDGGWRNDPDGHGQNAASLLGSILRLNVDGDTIIPADNPFVSDDKRHDLIWATGVRNPWKFLPLRDGRLMVADVGQNAWEEVSIATKGANLGWNVWEGEGCFVETCTDQDGFGVLYTRPVHTYGHDLGQSITGGVMVGSSTKPMYLFADFVTGKLWGMTDWDEQPTVTLLASLGFNVSTFGQDALGQTYVADFVNGIVYKINGLPE